MKALADISVITEIDDRPVAYTRATAAQAVGISVRGIDKELKEGRLACRYYGTKPLIPADELKSWLDSLPSEAPA